MRWTRTRTTLLALTVMICACPAKGAGQADITAPRVGETRVVPTTFLPDPFINTKVSLGLGYGKSSNILTPLLEIEGDPILGLEGDLLYLILDFEYKYAVREWVAVWARIRVAGRLGNEIQSILAQGVNAATGFELGWLFRLYETDRHYLSTGISVRNGSATLVDILGWANGIIEDEEVGLIWKSPTLGTVGEMHYAYAANDFTALQFLGQLSYSETVIRATNNEWYYGLGGLVSFDLAKRTDAPVGLALGYKYTTIPEGGDEIAEGTHAVLVGLSYMGRPDFSIGLDLEFQKVPLKGLDDPAKFFTATISSQYFF